MLNKLCSVMMSVLAFLTFSNTQGMSKPQRLFVKQNKAEVEKQRFELRKAEDHGSKFYYVHHELMDKLENRNANKKQLNVNKEQFEVVMTELMDKEFHQELKEKNAYKAKFNNVMIELDWFERVGNQAVLDDLDINRDCVFLRLLKDVTINLNSIKEEKNKFMAVLAELKKHDNSEEEQLVDSSVGLGELFANEFASTQAEQAAFSQLAQSIVSLEQSMQDIPELFGEAEKTVEPVKVGILTKLSDWWYGPSNLVSELSSEKISLDTLKKSPDMQARINYMIARHSLTTKTDIGTVSALVGIYTALNTLNFKFVDAEVNTALYNACKTLLVEKRNTYTHTREARIFAIAKYITSELNKMVAEQDPHAEAIAKLEELERLIGKVGMVEITAEDKVPYQSEPVVLEIVANLEKLSLALTVAEEAEKAAIK